MSGPVWQFEQRGPYRCDECLQEIEAAFVEGVVRDAELHPRRILCEACYRENIHLVARVRS